MILSGHNLTIGYRDRVVGRGLDVALATGDVLALLGPNGGGKTTLLKTLLGLLAAQSGEVRLGDRRLASLTSRERARLIAYVPQSHVATFAFTVEAVVLMGRTAHGNLFSRPSSADRAIAVRVLERFGIAHLRDFGNQGKVLREIRALALSGHGVLFTTHDPNHAMRAADRAYLLRDGIRVGEGATGVILTKAQLERLYGTSVETVNDSTGRTAFLPG
jgi:iron complex transport system ATP-binding protein